MVILMVPALTFLVIHSPKVQNRVVLYATEKLSESLNTKVTIGYANIGFFDRLNLSDFLVLDQSSDTLLYARKVGLQIRHYSRSKKKLTLQNITLHGALVHIVSDSSKNLNLQFLVDQLKKPADTTTKSIQLSCYSFEIKNGTFCYTSLIRGEKRNNGIDFTDMVLKNLNLSARDVITGGDSIGFRLKNLSFQDHSGFLVKRFRGNCSFANEFMHFRDVEIQTRESIITADYVLFDFNSYKYFRVGDFGKKVRMNVGITSSSIHFPDLAYFTSFVEGIPHRISLEGKASGVYSDLRFRNMKIYYNEDTQLLGNFNFSGFPDIKKTFIHLDIKKFITSARDIESLRIPKIGREIRLPVYTRDLGLFRYKGQFTGFFDDFVTYGKLITDQGEANADLVITHDTEWNTRFKGNIAIREFNLAPFAGEAKMKPGKISGQASIDGTKLKKDIQGNLTGSIFSLEFNGYTYSSIGLEGTFTDKTYDGSVSIEDKNLKMDFLGRLDFSDSIPEFDFTTHIPQANLRALNFSGKDSLTKLSCILTANFMGKSLSTMEGDIKLLNAQISKKNQSLLLYNLSLQARNNGNSQKLLLRSDFLDAELEGSYNLKTLTRSLREFIREYLPSLRTGNLNAQELASNDFKFELKLKDCSDLTKFFIPDFSFSFDTRFSGNYSPAKGFLELNGYSEKMGWKELVFQGFTLYSGHQNQNYIIETGSRKISYKDQVSLDNLTGITTLKNDTLYTTYRSINWDTLLHKGSLSAVGFVKKIPGSLSNQFVLDILPSHILVKNTAWEIAPCHLEADSSGIRIDQFNLYSKNQFVKIAGAVSKNENKSITIDVKGLRAENFNIFTTDKGFSFTGNMTGSAGITHFFSNPVFSGNFIIDSLSINGEVLGNTNITMEYLSDRKIIDLQVMSYRGNLRTLLSKGYYIPASRKIDMDMELNKLRINILRPYLSKVFSDINGLASGNIKLSGTTATMVLDGDLECQKASFFVDYLKTRYSFSDRIQIKNSVYLLNKITLFDENGNKAIVDGSITGEYFRNWSMNVRIDAKNFLALNTGSRDNSLFYGRTLASGTVLMWGKIPDISMDIKATTEKNTVFSIPLNTGEEVAEKKFITFVTELPRKKEKKKPVTTTTLPKGIEMNFELTITPDAEAYMIFDPKMGDKIKGRGNGSIRMEINTLGKFKMFGEYITGEGSEYLFTLQNVINKRLRVEPGGTISWNGDPLDANLNIKAIYPVKTSVYDLLPEENNPEYKKRIPIECQIFLTDKLMKPTIRYDIYLPSAEEELRSRVRNAISTEEELSKQFLSLLVINSFMPNVSGVGYTSSSDLAIMGGVGTGTEFLSNQLSNWLSQISKDVDLGVNYRPGNEITSQQIEVGLSKQLLNDRVTLNGNVDLGKNTQTTSNTSNMVGDFELDVKLDETGKFRVKAFNRSNNQILYNDKGPYTQGVGISYQEEFNNFNELLKRYLQKEAGKSKEDIPLDSGEEDLSK